jgi:hypothetical protein
MAAATAGKTGMHSSSIWTGGAMASDMTVAALAALMEAATAEEAAEAAEDSAARWLGVAAELAARAEAVALAAMPAKR